MPTPANPEQLQAALALLRQLRDIKGVREIRPGVFHNRGASFVQLYDEAGQLVADLKKAGGAGFDRYALDTPAGQRKLIDDAKRRAACGDDD